MKRNLILTATFILAFARMTIASPAPTILATSDYERENACDTGSEPGDPHGAISADWVVSKSNHCTVVTNRTTGPNGRLGDKNPTEGGYYRRSGKKVEVLDLGSGEYYERLGVVPVEFVGRMKHLHHVGRYRDALEVLCEAGGEEAALTRRTVLGYVSYALNRVGEVADSAEQIDEIMSDGYNWAPPSIFVDLIGARRVYAMLKHGGLEVPR